MARRKIKSNIPGVSSRIHSRSGKLNKVLSLIQSVASFIKKRVKSTLLILRRHPFLSFLVALGLLLVTIVLVNTVLKPKPEEVKEMPQIKKVEVYRIGESPKLSLQGQVEKSSVVKIAALSPGVVQAIKVREGDFVSKGAGLVNLSTNYQGGNALSVSRQIAQTQLNNVNQTFDTQKEIILKQRDIVSATDTNNDKLREIQAQSIDETNSLIDLNSAILSTLESNQSAYEATNSAGFNNPLILQTQTLRSQFLAANNQLRSQLRQTEFSSSADKPLAQISDLTREITLKQLEIQEKGLELSKEVARLQLSLASIQEAIMFPSAPYSGIVERIYVRAGQQVSPGTPLLLLSGTAQNVNVYVKVSSQIAKSVSSVEASVIHFNNHSLVAYPDFISNEATDGSLYVVHYLIPSEAQTKLADASIVLVEVPIGLPDTSSAIPFIPLDCIFQSQSESFVFVIKDGKAEAREVNLGEVFGRFVQVESGLDAGDQVILSRNIISGEQVTP